MAGMRTISIDFEYFVWVFADDSKLEQAADVIHKLHTMSYDLTDQK